MTEPTLPTEQPEKAIAVDGSGRMNYGTAAAEGRIEIELPSLPGSPNATERMHTRQFGVHVLSQTESAFRRQPYMTTGPTQSPAQVLKHYAAVARGAELADRATLKRMDEIAAEFSKMPNKPEQARAYFAEVVKPFLLSLSPGKR